jgi:hypothetical protein
MRRRVLFALGVGQGLERLEEASPGVGETDDVKEAGALARGYAIARVANTLRLVHRSRLTQRIRQIGKDLAQHFLATPVLEASMHRLVVCVALRQRVPLRPGIEDPHHTVEYLAGRDRFATGRSSGKPCATRSPMTHW